MKKIKFENETVVYILIAIVIFGFILLLPQIDEMIKQLISRF